MTLLDLLREHGDVGVRLVSHEGDQGAVFVRAGGREIPMQLDDVKFKGGGALTTLHTVELASGGDVGPVDADAVVGGAGWTCAPDALVCEACQ